MTEHALPAAPAQQSSFVTGLAWTLIVLYALGVLVLLLQNLTLNLMFDTLVENAPAGSETTLTLFRSLGFVFLAICLFLTYAAYALLKRRNWARITYIAVFALAIVSHILSALGVAMGLAAGSGTAMLEGSPESAAIMRATMIVFVVILLGFTVVFVWLIKRLTSPEIKAEFAG
jgi:hypothetical protein